MTLRLMKASVGLELPIAINVSVITCISVKSCTEIPYGFRGDWKVRGSDKIVEFRAKYYRVHGSQGNDPFCMSLYVSIVDICM